MPPQLIPGWDFVFSFFSIILIDLILSGDNAVVIAMAVKTLPRAKRRMGIFVGVGAAVALRVLFTFFAARFLQVEFIKCVGGVLILWIAVKLFIDDAPEEEEHRKVQSIWHAMWIIMVADITMSLDNILAVAGACKGSMVLLLFGLGLSIPLIIFTSSLLSMLMDKYPFIIYIGSAILGQVGGEMIMTDPFIVRTLAPPIYIRYGVDIFFAVGVVVTGKCWINYLNKKQKGG
jgi:YjbE family integral membrane protein